MMNTPVAPADIAAPVGAYSHGMVVPAGARTLHVAGQVGIDAAGALPEDFAAQAANCWRNLLAVLAAAGMTMADVVRINTYVTDPADLPALAAVRAGFLGDYRPASTLLVVKALARPGWKIEIDAVAAQAPGAAVL